MINIEYFKKCLLQINFYQINQDQLIVLILLEVYYKECCMQPKLMPKLMRYKFQNKGLNKNK